MKYTIKRIYNGMWAVINTDTGLAQSTWMDKIDAVRTAKDLNKPMFVANGR